MQALLWSAKTVGRHSGGAHGLCHEKPPRLINRPICFSMGRLVAAAGQRRPGKAYQGTDSQAESNQTSNESPKSSGAFCLAGQSESPSGHYDPFGSKPPDSPPPIYVALANGCAMALVHGVQLPVQLPCNPRVTCVQLPCVPPVPTLVQVARLHATCTLLVGIGGSLQGRWWRRNRASGGCAGNGCRSAAAGLFGAGGGSPPSSSWRKPVCSRRTRAHQ